jgi:heme iron utilization protein
MSKLAAVKKYIEEIFETSRFAVLATEGDGQPHASYIAITPMHGYQELIFATYRNTQKHLNLTRNGKVALLVESGKYSNKAQQNSFVLTALGHMKEIDASEKEIVFNTHLEWHPDLLTFMQAEDCTIVRIKVDLYQVVRGIDDVEWWSIKDLDNHNSI